MLPNLEFVVCLLVCISALVSAGKDREVLEVYLGHHAHGGVRQRGVNDVQTCIARCAGRCMAVDFNEDDNSCWFHTSDSVCNPLVPKEGCRHYKFVTCDPGEHLASGVLQPGIRDPTTCVNLCWDKLHCGGVDFNTKFKSCWFHDYKTICGARIEKAHCNHIRLRPAVCAAELDGYHAFGGKLQLGIRDENTCLSSCRTGCDAADFDTSANTCYHHTKESACSRLNIKPTCTHFKFTHCATTTSTTPPPTTVTTTIASPTTVSFTTSTVPSVTNQGTNQGTNVATAATTTQSGRLPDITVHDGRHASGGQPQPQLADLDQCLETCALSPDCLAADFNYVTQSCWFHGAASACSQLREKDDCVHVKLLSCGTG